MRPADRFSTPSLNAFIHSCVTSLIVGVESFIVNCCACACAAKASAARAAAAVVRFSLMGAPLFGLDADIAHDLGPRRSLGLDEGVNRSWGAGAVGKDAELLHASLNGGVLEHLVHLGIHSLDDLGRRADRRHHDE